MDSGKLDPVLAAELSGESHRDVTVFIHVATGVKRDDGERLAQQLGLGHPVTAGSVLSLTMPAERIRELSDEPWVVAIRAARRLRPLG